MLFMLAYADWTIRGPRQLNLLLKKEARPCRILEWTDRSWYWKYRFSKKFDTKGFQSKLLELNRAQHATFNISDVFLPFISNQNFPITPHSNERRELSFPCLLPSKPMCFFIVKASRQVSKTESNWDFKDRKCLKFSRNNGNITLPMYHQL